MYVCVLLGLASLQVIITGFEQACTLALAKLKKLSIDIDSKDPEAHRSVPAPSTLFRRDWSPLLIFLSRFSFTLLFENFT